MQKARREKQDTVIRRGKTGMVALVVERGGRRQVNREEEREEGQITSRIFENVTRNHIIFIYLSLHLIYIHVYNIMYMSMHIH